MDLTNQHNRPTWSHDIAHLFTALDVNCMKPRGIHLDSYDDVKKNAAAILGQVQAGNMPPAHSGEPAWPVERVKLFEEWITGGCAH